MPEPFESGYNIHHSSIIITDTIRCVAFLDFLPQKLLTFQAYETLRGMRESLVHRGPDDMGEYIRPFQEGGPFVFLGHRRLSIIDLSGGHQPLSNEDETVWVIFNGEIYNFKELREEFGGQGASIPHPLRYGGHRPRL